MEERVLARLEEWRQGYYAEEDRVLRELFTNTYPDNSRFDEVLIKVAALNSLYSAGLRKGGLCTEMAQRILRPETRQAIQAGSHDAVELIARKPGQKEGGRYSFATKYCSFCKPEQYSIYDSLACLALVQLMEVNYEFCGCKKTKSETKLQSYPRYHRAIGEFMQRFHLSKFSRKQIDMFLWLEGQAI